MIKKNHTKKEFLLKVHTDKKKQSGVPVYTFLLLMIIATNMKEQLPAAHIKYYNCTNIVQQSPSYQHKFENNNIDKQVRLFLKKPWETFKKYRIPNNFHIITLSFLSEYIVNLKLHNKISLKESEAILTRCINIALNKKINPYHNISSESLSGHGLYLGHLNIILGSYRYLTGNDRYTALNTKISYHLAKESVTDPFYHISSYAKTQQRWPADQAAVLYSLHLYDLNYNQSISRKPVRLWLGYMSSKGLSDKWGLHKSEITMSAPYSQYPRGCALSFTIRYMALFAPVEARKQWKEYKSRYLVNTSLITGFREWPPGIKKKADTDSGPIIYGIGTAASGIALAASKTVNDRFLFARLLLSKNLVLATNNRRLKFYTNSILSKAIMLYAETYTPWFNGK